MGRGQVHYIEMTLDNEEDEDFSHIQNIEADTTETTKEEDEFHESMIEERPTLEYISGVLK
jgi:hypothetical protein